MKTREWKLALQQAAGMLYYALIIGVAWRYACYWIPLWFCRLIVSWAWDFTLAFLIFPLCESILFFGAIRYALVCLSHFFFSSPVICGMRFWTLTMFRMSTSTLWPSWRVTTISSMRTTMWRTTTVRRCTGRVRSSITLELLLTCRIPNSLREKQGRFHSLQGDYLPRLRGRPAALLAVLWAARHHGEPLGRPGEQDDTRGEKGAHAEAIESYVEGVLVSSLVEWRWGRRLVGRLELGFDLWRKVFSSVNSLSIS